MEGEIGVSVVGMMAMIGIGYPESTEEPDNTHMSLPEVRETFSTMLDESRAPGHCRRAVPHVPNERQRGLLEVIIRNCLDIAQDFLRIAERPCLELLASTIRMISIIDQGAGGTEGTLKILGGE